MFSKQFEEPLLSINWSKNNIIGFSHGETVEIMVWKYSKASRKLADELIDESRAANDHKKWNFYEPTSKEYLDGFRIWFKF